MTLRTKTLFQIAVTLVALVVTLYFLVAANLQSGFKAVETNLGESSKRIEQDLTGGFAIVEDDDARNNVMRVFNSIQMRLDNLAVKTSDWAMWDDTYQFVDDKNQDYIKTNINADSLKNLQINMLLIYNSDGKEIFSSFLDLEAENPELTAIPESVKKLLNPDSPLLKHPDEKSVKKGIVPLPENPLMLASLPIVKTDGNGPVRGSIIFARYFDQAESNKISEVTELDFSYRLFNDAKLPADMKEARDQIADFRIKNPPPSADGEDSKVAAERKEYYKKSLQVKTLSKDVIMGWGPFVDIDGNPLLLLNVAIDRKIHRQGQKSLDQIRRQGKNTLAAIQNQGQTTMKSVIFSIVLSGIVLSLVILLVLELSVLSRVAKLSSRAEEIGSSGDFSGRVQLSGKDELSRLGGAINGMLEALATTHRKIEVRNSEMRLLMNTLPTGLISLDEQYNINPEYSRSAEVILGINNLSGKSYLDVLRLDKATPEISHSFHDFLDLLRNETLPEQDMAELNPCEQLKLVIDDTVRWINLSHHIIRRGENQTNHILVVIRDITGEKELAAQIEVSQRENVQLKAIAEDPDLFREFLVEARNILSNINRQCEKLDTNESSRPIVNEIFRGVHTIKGVAGSFGLYQLSDLAGKLEDNLSELRKGGQITRDNISQTTASVGELYASMNEIVESARKILGDEIAGEKGILLRIPLEELKQHIGAIQNLAIDEAFKQGMLARLKEEVLRRLTSMRTVPARKGLARALKIVPDLIRRMQKNVSFTVEGNDTPIDCELAQEINASLVHILRNAFDHGIETAEERSALGKPAEGRVSLSIRRENNRLTFKISDDGKGIKPERVKETAVVNGLLTLEQAANLSVEETYQLLFKPGFSTAEHVTEISGRGVGLDVVKKSIEDKLGGDLSVTSQPGAGTTFTLNIPVE